MILSASRYGTLKPGHSASKKGRPRRAPGESDPNRYLLRDSNRQTLNRINAHRHYGGHPSISLRTTANTLAMATLLIEKGRHLAGWSGPRDVFHLREAIDEYTATNLIGSLSWHLHDSDLPK